ESLSELPLISTLLESGHYIDQIMQKAVEPYIVKELDRQPVHFFCRCSPERFKDALSLLSYEDLKELKGNDQEMLCHFCGTKHVVSEQEIHRIIESAKAKLN
ncbi:MAG: Hsp33 family molecular chaperone HslO, partial [Balneolaceae bacterium]